MTLSFKYRKEIFEGKVRYFPKIPILLSNKGLQIQTAALVDSGAMDIFIPRELADALGLKLKNQDMAECWGGEFKVWESRVNIVVGRGSQTFRKTLPCNVPDKKGENEEVVFGRTFFHFFEIFFNENERITKLRNIEGAIKYKNATGKFHKK